MKAKRIILHLGLFKTGSTALQRRLHAASDILLRHGINFPKFSWNHGLVLYPVFDEIRIARMADGGLARGHHADALNRQSRDALRMALEQNQSPEIILSGEHFSALTDEGAQRLVTAIAPWTEEIQIVAYLRHPWDYATSMAQQLIRDGEIHETVLQSPIPPRYRTTLQKFIGLVGQKNVQIRRFVEPHECSWDVVEDFVQMIGRPEIIQKIEPISSTGANRSFSRGNLASINAVNKCLPGGINNPARAARLPRAFASGDDGVFALPADMLARTMESAQEDIDWLREKFGVSWFSFPEPSSRHQGDPELGAVDIDRALAVNQRALSEQNTQACAVLEKICTQISDRSPYRQEDLSRAILDLSSAPDAVSYANRLAGLACHKAALWTAERACHIEPENFSALLLLHQLTAKEKPPMSGNRACQR